ncbi:MAG: universal stress protein [Alphaproteobacteria bacterium]
MKNVLLLVHDDSGQEARLQGALDAVRALEGHLACVHVTELLPLFGDAYGMSGAVMVQDAALEAETRNRIEIERRLAREDVPWDWVELMGGIEAALAQASGLADLIVVNGELPRRVQPQVRTVVERLVVQTDKPLLVVGDEPKGFRPAEPVLVAWDGSEPASAAVRSAVPLLKLSSAVTVYEVDDGSVEKPAEEVASYLSRHGIGVEVDRDEVPNGDYVEPLLLSKLESGDFGWAVIGAFSRSRFREALFGGTTKRLLKESPVPLVIAH